MSAEPRNALWNRLLARAEARAKQETPPETHLFRPRSPGDRHLRTSLENSLIYHGLKIETEFNLRLQRPPRKRKAKRKGGLPVAERLRNDRAAAGSPGPTHRTPTGTPARRISKTTPLSRPPIPPAPPLPPIPPIPVTTRAAAARERVLNAVSDDDHPPVRGAGPVAELSDSSDDGVFLSRTTKPDGGAVIVLPHFDQAANSNDTSSWEEDAVLVQQPPKEQDSDGNASKKPEGAVRTPSDMSPVPLELGPRYATSKRDRARRAKSRRIASSDSSPAPDSESAKHRLETHSADEGEDLRQGSGQRVKGSERRNMIAQPALKRRKEMDTSKADGEKSKKNMSESGDASKEGKDSCAPCEKIISREEQSLPSRVKTPIWLQSENRQPSPLPVLSLSSSSNDEAPTPRRPSPPMRAVPARRRTPSDVSVDDKLFGPLSPLSSPRRRAQSMSGSGACVTISDGASSVEEVKKKTSPRRRNHEKNAVASGSPKSNTKSQTQNAGKITVRRSPRRSRRSQGGEKRSCDLEVIASGPTSVKQTSREQDNALTKPGQSRGQRRTVRKSAPRESSSDMWEDEPSLNPIAVDSPTNLPKKTRGNKSSPVSSLSGRKDDGDATNAKRASVQTKKRTSRGTDFLATDYLEIGASPGIGTIGDFTGCKLLRITSSSLSDYESSDDQSKYVAIPRNKLGPLKRKRAVRPSSRSTRSIDNQNKPTSLQGAAQGKSSLGSAKRKDSARRQANTGNSSEVLEIRDSDSDVCIVSFSPAKARRNSTNSPRKINKRDASRKRSGKNSSNFGKREATNSSGDSNASPSMTSPKCKLPLRIRRPIELQSSSRDNSESPTGRAGGSGSTQAGPSLIASESDEGSFLEVKQAVRTSPRRKIPLLLDRNTKQQSNLKRDSRTPTGLSDGSDGIERVVISSDSDEGSRKAVKQKSQTSPTHMLPLRIPMSSKGHPRGDRLVAMSDSEGSDSSFGLSWARDYEKSKEVGKKGESKRRSTKRSRESATKGRRGRGRGGSSSGAKNSDSCVDVDRPLNGKDGSKESSHKKRRRK